MELPMICWRVCTALVPFSAISSAASPATCGDAWLVPMKPLSRLPAEQAVSTGTPAAVRPARRYLGQYDHTHDAMSLPHGHGDTVKPCAASALPPGAATVTAERPKLV